MPHGLLQAPVLAADVLDADLLAPDLGAVEGDPRLERDADDDERPAGLEQGDGLVEGGLIAAALEDEVEAGRFAGQDRADDVLAVGISRPVRAGRRGRPVAGPRSSRSRRPRPRPPP